MAICHPHHRVLPVAGQPHPLRAVLDSIY
jgi:hypothetical protein